MLEVGVQNWALVAEVDRMVHRMVAFPQVPQPVQVPLLSLHFEDSILPAVNIGKLI
jgi:hypothetical protein